MSTPPDDAPTFEQVLADCIEGYATVGAEGVDAICALHPEWSERLRARLDHLQRLGLLVEEREDHVPESLGPYRLLKRLGAGGMSVVYLAHDERLDRHVAVKRCHESLGAGERMRRRFEHEIRAVAQLHHPGIVDIFDVGEDGERPYFVMEHVRGATLAQIVEALRDGRTPFEELNGESVRLLAFALDESADVIAHDAEDGAERSERWGRSYVETVCRLVLDVAEALDHAHRNGIVHRDVKPSNIMVRRDGRALLFDLGLARLEDQPGLTRSGDLTGTPSYVSPEQLRGERSLDARTDVYSLGVSLFELLALRRPFEGPNTAAVFRAIEDGDAPALAGINPSVPLDLETICRTAMAPLPSSRYATAENFAADLRRFLAYQPIRAQQPSVARRLARWSRRRPAAALAAALTLLVLLGLPIGLFIAHRAVSREAAEAVRQAEEAQRQAAASRAVTDSLVELFRLSPTDLLRKDDVTAREILDRHAARLPTQLVDQPLTRAALMAATGRVYRNLGLDQRALPLLSRSLAIMQRTGREAHIDGASVLHDLADVNRRLERYSPALVLGERALVAFADAGLEAHPAVVRCHVTLARCHLAQNDLELASTTLDRALALADTIDLGSVEGLASIYETRGRVALAADNLDDAVGQLSAAWTIRRSLRSPDRTDLARSLDLLAQAYTARDHDEDRQRAAQLAADGARLRRATTRPQGVLANPFEIYPPWLDEYEPTFQDGITALQTGHPGVAVAAFKRCIEWRPHRAIHFYNMACAAALEGDVSTGFARIEEAIARGLTSSVESSEGLVADPDLNALRSDPRWDALERRALDEGAAIRDFVTTPAYVTPSGPPPPDGWPLLVVLHRNGASRDDVLNGEWRDVADQLGVALLAPSAPTAMGRHVDEGMIWFDDAATFTQSPWTVTENVGGLVRHTLALGKFDRRSVVIVGEGLAALIASDLAFSAPGLYRGLVVVDGPLAPELVPERVALASAVGLPVRLVNHTTPDASTLEPWLASWGFDDVRAMAPALDATRDIFEMLAP